MTDVLNFKTTPAGNDTGEADSDAIAPIQNGEPADQATLARADETLRNRTEVLRSEANANRWARDADRGAVFFLSTGGSIQWTGPYDTYDGELVLSAGASFLIASMIAPGEPRSADNEGSGTRFPTRYATAAFEDGGAGQWDVQADVFEFDGSFAVTIEVTDSAGSGDPPTVEVLGDGSVVNPAVQPGQRRIQVTYDSLEGHTVQDIVDAINGDIVAGGLVTATATDGGDTAYDIAETALSGGSDGVYHEITDAQLDAFFTVSGDNALREGDTLAIWYDTVQLRRESVEENSGKHLVPAASLVNLTAEPEKRNNAVVIGRVVGGDFVFANGALLQPGGTTTVIAGGPAATIVVDDTSWTVLSGTTVQAALDSADTEIDTLRDDIERGNASAPAAGDGAAVGADYMGVDSTPFNTVSASVDSTQETFEALDTYVSDLRSPLVLWDNNNDGALRIGVTATDVPAINPAGDNVKEAFLAVDNHLTRYASVGAMIDAVDDGEIRWVDPAQDTDINRVAVTSGDTGIAASVTGIDTDGRYLVTAFSNTLSVYDVDDLGSGPLTTRQPDVNTAGVYKYVAINGSYIAAYVEHSGTSYVEVYDYTGLPSAPVFQWRYALATAPASTEEALVWWGDDVFILDGSFVRSFSGNDSSPPTELDSFDHGATIRSIATNGHRIFVLSDVAGAGGYSIRALSPLTLNSDQGAAIAPVPLGVQQLAADEQSVYFVEVNTGATPDEFQLTKWSVHNLADEMLLQQSITVSDSGDDVTLTKQCIAVDDNYLYLSAGYTAEVATIYVLDKATLGEVAWFRFSIVADAGVAPVAVDGDQFYTCLLETGVETTISALRVLQPPRQWQKISSARRMRRRTQLALPVR